MSREDRPAMGPARDAAACRAEAELPPEDRRLVESLRRVYGPTPEDLTSRAAFEATLRQRIEAESAPRWRWLPALAGAAAALAAVWLGQAWIRSTPLPERSAGAVEARRGAEPGVGAVARLAAGAGEPGAAARPSARGTGPAEGPAAGGSPAAGMRSRPERAPEVGLPKEADELAWEESLFFPTAHLAAEEGDDLPADYRLLASAFLAERR